MKNSQRRLLRGVLTATLVLSACQAVTREREGDLSPPCETVSDCVDGDDCTAEECIDGRCRYTTITEPEADSDGDGLSCLEGDCHDLDGEILPGSQDVCDGKDNDCDGTTDEDAAGAGEPCDTGDLGRCGRGLRQCRGGEMVCIGSLEPFDEACNGEDDDCDGYCDEDFACCVGETRPCEVSSGDCVASGSQRCSAECAWESVCEPPPELCNGEDDNCDGRIDEAENMECAPGDTESEACGRCGTRARSCSSSCEWGSFGICEGEHGCVSGDTRTEACGSCGTKEQTCNSDCEWEDTSSCTGEGACCPGDTQGCRTSCDPPGAQSCSAAHIWGACVRPCSPNVTVDGPPGMGCGRYHQQAHCFQANARLQYCFRNEWGLIGGECVNYTADGCGDYDHIYDMVTEHCGDWIEMTVTDRDSGASASTTFTPYCCP